MPLWSNEEWRARIGSCWCVLGRPFNTRFTRCRGKSRGMLTLHQVATMVIMMMLLIAANLGLAAAQGHHKMFISTCMLLFGDVIVELHAFRLVLILMSLIPILKMGIQMVYHLLPHRANASLGQFYMDLTHCFQLIKYLMWLISSPATYIVNSVISEASTLLRSVVTEPVEKWTQDQSDSVLTQGSSRRSLVVVVIVTIQLLVTVCIAHSVIVFLLLTSGDVEQNPGPCQTEDTSRTCIGWTCISHLVIGLWNKLFSWDLFLSTNRVLPRLYIVGALAIAILVVTMELGTSAAVQASLLLRCGDIELNPGPITREDKLPRLHELTLLRYSEEVKNEGVRVISEASYKWTAAAVDGSSCSAKAMANANPAIYRETEVITLVAKNRAHLLVVIRQLLLVSGDVELNPGPLDVLDLKSIVGELGFVMNKWFQIGVQLGINEANLHQIEADHRTVERCFLEMTSFWLKGNTQVAVTWKSIIDVLESQLVNEKGLANQLREKAGMKLDDKRETPLLTASKPDYERELNRLLEKEGYVELNMSKLLITGPAGSGKTCTRHILYKKSPPSERVSTELLEHMKRAYVYYTDSESDLDEYDWIVVDEDNHELYQMLAATVNLSQESKGIKYRRANHDSPAEERESVAAPLPGHRNSPQTSSIVHESDGKKLLLQSMSNPSSVGKCVHKVHWIHFLDSGGQSAFHDILPAFVHNISVVIFVLNLSEAMDELPFDDYYEGGKRIGDTHKRAPYQVTEILKGMIQSICNESNDCKLLIVGTHFDKKSAKKSLSDKNAAIKSLLDSFVTHNQLKVICHGDFEDKDILFPLNAKDQDEKSKIEAKTMRKRIVEKCRSAKPVPIPVSWFLLEEDLRVSGMGSEHGILEKSECKDIVQSLNITSLSDALQYFHSLNIFLYFPKSQLLSNLVFTKPEIVVTIVSQFVKIAYNLRRKLTDTEFINYAKKGQFTKDLVLREEFKIARYTDAKLEIEQMIELLCITSVAAPISEGKYFIPCVLNHCHPDKVKKLVSKQTKCVAPMVIKFPGECVPRGFFCALVCSLLSRRCRPRWELRCIGNDFAKVYKNFVHFDIEGEGYTVAVVDSFLYISVHVFGNCGRKGCSAIKEVLKASVKEINTKHNYENHEFSVLFICPCGRVPEQHCAEIIREETLGSDEILRLKCMQQQGRPLDLTKEHAAWLPLTEMQWKKVEHDQFKRRMKIILTASIPVVVALLAVAVGLYLYLFPTGLFCDLLSTDYFHPTLYLLESFKVIERIGASYMQFGTIILKETTGNILESIEHSCMHQVNCINYKILQNWLEGDARFYEPTWSNLVNVLCQIGRKALAEDLIGILKSHGVDTGMNSCL